MDMMSRSGVRFHSNTYLRSRSCCLEGSRIFPIIENENELRSFDGI